MTAAPAARGATVEPVGMASEVPRRSDQVQDIGLELGAVDLLQLLGMAGVPAAEVDGLGDLGVRLGEGLAGLGSGHCHEVPAALGQLVGGAVENLRALPGPALAPALGSIATGLHDLGDVVELERVRGGQTLVPGPVRDQIPQLERPLLVRRDRDVGVRLVAEGLVERLMALVAALAPGGLLRAVLHAVRARGALAVQDHALLEQLLDGGAEAALLAAEDLVAGLDLEDPGHEVLGLGVLLEAAHQVGHGDVELLRGHGGDVVEHSPDVLGHGDRLLGGHALQHLELDALGDPALLGEQLGEGDVEDVVPRHAHAHPVQVLGVHGPGQDPLVVGVRGLLGRHDGQRPVVHLGVHALHGQVGALDQADLDLRAALGHAPLAPLGQVLHRAQGIGQVGLHDDARLQVLQLGPREQRGEDLGGQVQVRVDLHVQVDDCLLYTSPSPRDRG